MILTAFDSKIRLGMQSETISETCSFLIYCIYKTIYLYFQQENHKKTETYDLHIPQELQRQSVQVFVFFSEAVIRRCSVKKVETVAWRYSVKKVFLKMSPVTLLKKRL